VYSGGPEKLCIKLGARIPSKERDNFGWHLPSHFKVHEMSGMRSIFATLFSRWRHCTELPSSRVCRHQHNHPVLNWKCRLTCIMAVKWWLFLYCSNLLCISAGANAEHDKTLQNSWDIISVVLYRNIKASWWFVVVTRLWLCVCFSVFSLTTLTVFDSRYRWICTACCVTV